MYATMEVNWKEKVQATDYAFVYRAKKDIVTIKGNGEIVTIRKGWWFYRYMPGPKMGQLEFHCSYNALLDGLRPLGVLEPLTKLDYESTKIRFGVRSKYQLPLFMVWREYWNKGEVVYAEVLYASN